MIRGLNIIDNEDWLMLVNKFAIISGLAISVVSVSSAFAAYNCPAPEEIQATDFTVPSIWIAPPVAQSLIGRVGVGFGGKKATKLLGVEPIQDGWVCVYKSKDGSAISELQTKIRGLIAGNKFLIRYLNDVNDAFEKAQPFLKPYMQHGSVGFVGYHIQPELQYPYQQYPSNQKK